MSLHRPLILLPPFFVLGIFGFSFVFQSASASPYPTVSQEDLRDERAYSPFVDRSYPDQVFFGDTHFHTEVSFDAGLIGTTLDIHDAFRLARGEKVISNTGQPVQLIRPLDFLAVT